MAFFVNPGKDWENNLTEEDIAKLEAQGCDVSGLRNRPPVPEDDDEEEEAFDNPTRLDRLKPYLQTPRDMETSFFRAVAGNAPWLFKDRWKKKYTESPVIYAAVVQANSALWGDRETTITIRQCLFLPSTRSTFTMWNGYRKWQKRSANCQIVLLLSLIHI